MKKRSSRIAALLLAVAVLFGVFAASAEGSAPIAENLEFETYRGVSFGGKLSALATDGEVAGFEITTQPRKGEISLEPDGSFVYTPLEGKKGRDYFGYKAIDSEGNYSQEATVIIKLIKCGSDISYADMKGNKSEYAAMKLCDCGAFVGKSIGGRYYFEPSSKVTRGEFLSLCLEISSSDLLSGVVATGFSDDSEIPEYYKPYVATAVMNGIVSGRLTDGSCVFDADESISRPEAMVILSRTLSLCDVSYVNVGDELPEWAVQSAANLSACGIVSDITSDECLTRAECAEMLASAMSFLNKR